MFDDEDFDDGPAATVATAPRPEPVAPAVAARTTARRIAPAAYLLLPDDQWTPADLRDYAVTQICDLFGPLAARNPAVEMSIFKGFASRWGAQAPAILRYAFVINKGWWNSAPITLNRFCAKSDPYFAAEIVKRLPQADR